MPIDAREMPGEIARRGWSVVIDEAGAFRLATSGAPSALWALCDGEPPASGGRFALNAILELRRLGRIRYDEEQVVNAAFCGRGATALMSGERLARAMELRAALTRLAQTGSV